MIPQPLVTWGVVLPRRTGWTDMTSRQRGGVVVRAVLQTGLLVIALRDLRKRPAARVRGSKWVWAGVSCVNYLGVGPIAYLAVGRRPATEVSISDVDSTPEPAGPASPLVAASPGGPG